MGLRKAIWDWLQKQADLSEASCRDAMLVLCQRVSSLSTILDCGCSDGEFTARVAEAVKAARSVGIDVVPGQIAAARTRGIEGIVGSLDGGLPLANESVDVVVASHVIEHVANTDTLVKELYRVLKPDGYIIMATPNLAAFTNILFLILGKQPTIAEVSDVALVGTWSPRGSHVDRTGPAHRRIFTRGALKGLLQYSGFKGEKVVGSGFLPLPASVAKLAASLLPRYASNIIIGARKPRES